MTDPATLIDCIYCEALNEDNEIFCWSCGKQFVNDMRRKQIESMDRYFEKEAEEWRQAH